MKKYIAPEAAIVNLAAETTLMLTVSLPNGGPKDGVIIGSNFRYEEEWEEEEF